MATLLTLVMAGLVSAEVAPGGMLYPRESETREVRSLDGIWNFRLSDSLEGYTGHWQAQDLSKTGKTIPMPVPASYNDITQDRAIRDHIGLVWYDRTFFVPLSWKKYNQRIWLRFGSVHYIAQVWVNGELVMVHEIGHLPFQSEVTQHIVFGGKNRVTVAVDNTLLQTSVPQGSLVSTDTNNGSRIYQSYTFDFFNYAGIHRSVQLYTTPAIYIDDITVQTDFIDESTGSIQYNITYSGFTSETPVCQVNVLDANGVVVANETTTNLQGELSIPNVKPWWPYLMDPEPGYLYTLEVTLQSNDSDLNDIYRLPVGIRTLSWDNTTFQINNRNVYMRGFGRHEDSDIRGKGLDYALITKDYNLLQWVGANSYRTSHYPYAEEIMDFADRQGIMIVDECPSVNTENYSPALLQKHKDSLEELIRRDKNRPSVIMWSVANEARTQLPAAKDYFRAIVDHVKLLDLTRPTTMAIARSYAEDLAAQSIDIIAFNRYNAWYRNGGLLETIKVNVVREAKAWHSTFQKPVFMSEYGADTMEGLHLYPEYIWSEEYQQALFAEHFKAFDELRKEGFFIGEMIWNFADFKTAETYTRVGGNKKGIFTRARQPKAVAHLVRQRYMALAQEIDDVPLPEDISYYISSKLSFNATVG